MARSKRTIGYAVIGLGDIAQTAILPAFKNARENSRLAALVSGDPSKRRALGRRYKVPVYRPEDLDECLASDEVDALYVALPNTMHADVTVRAAQAGVHVLCEKPMATSAKECERMIAACRENDVKLMIAYRLHFEPVTLKAIEIARRDLGELRFFDSAFGYQVTPDNIRTQKKLGGGALFDLGVYCINASRYLLADEPTEVFAYELGRGTDPRFEDLPATYTAMLKFPGERVATFTCSFDAVENDWFNLVGTKGELFADTAYGFGERFLRVVKNGRVTRRSFKPTDHFGPELIAFSKSIIDDSDVSASGEEGLADVRIVEAIQESAGRHAPVAIRAPHPRRRPSLRQAIRKPAVKAPATVHSAPPH